MVNTRVVRYLCNLQSDSPNMAIQSHYNILGYSLYCTLRPHGSLQLPIRPPQYLLLFLGPQPPYPLATISSFSVSMTLCLGFVWFCLFVQSVF